MVSESRRTEMGCELALKRSWVELPVTVHNEIQTVFLQQIDRIIVYCLSRGRDQKLRAGSGGGLGRLAAGGIVCGLLLPFLILRVRTFTGEQTTCPTMMP